MQDTEKTLNLTKTAQYIGIKKRTAHNMLNEKRFPVAPLSGVHPRRWAVADLDAWLRQNEETPAKTA